MGNKNMFSKRPEPVDFGFEAQSELLRYIKYFGYEQTERFILLKAIQLCFN